MSALYILIGISIAVAAGFLAAFIHNAGKGQFDDDYGPAIRMLFDDKVPSAKKSSTKQNTNDAN